jgi:prenyl protein peptidase
MYPYIPLLTHILSSLLQFAYTALFGWFAAFVFVRTANLPAVVLVHSLANFMGLPRVWGAVGVADSEGEKGSGKVLLHTALYYGLLLAGAFGFVRLLWPLTESENGLVRGF